MSATSIMPYSTTNQILAQLPGDVLSAMQPFLTRVRLVVGQRLIEADCAITEAYFPEEGVISLVADVNDARSGVQVAMIGREGMVGGLAMLAHGKPTGVSAVSQIPGSALRIGVGHLRPLFDSHGQLRDACMQFVHSLTMQAMQNAAYNAQRSLADRCVRWLLMTDERVDRGELPITHESLSRILGVRRAGVTVVAATLQEAGLIRVSRGRITILNRAGLKRWAQEPGAQVTGAQEAGAQKVDAQKVDAQKVGAAGGAAHAAISPHEAHKRAEFAPFGVA